MSLPPSSSDGGGASSSFSLLHPRVQRWIWAQGWKELRDIQEAAISPVQAGVSDVILSASTASGKTEAAFLPICSRLADGAEGSVRAIYVGPLKALINDQFQRLEGLCEGLGIPVHRWHGDVSQGHKGRLLKSPGGILLITPESLEALFVRQGPALKRLLSGLEHIVIDELHAFIGTERGCQLQSLLHRMELLLRRKVPRIGLSATLGDMSLAADFLRPGAGRDVLLLASPSGGGELRLQLRGYRTRAPDAQRLSAAASEGDSLEAEDEWTEDVHAIGAHLFQALRGTHNLVFANSRKNVEGFADLLRQMCEQSQLPNEFFPHHGNLSKELREEAEAALKARQRPVSLVCTTTLEMGIDVGSVQSVAQIGVAPSVASLRQRLGRSGRKGGPATLRIYHQESELTENSPLPDQLRVRLVQSVAMVELLLAGWCEPPSSTAFHFSTLVQQVLSLIAQYGGVKAAEVFSALCQQGPFARVSPEDFVRFLRELGRAGLLEQSNDGTLLLGRVGERIVNHYSFYAAFASPEEFRLVTAGRTLGSMPIDQPLFAGMFLIFGGRRWKVLSVHVEEKVVELEPAPMGRVPQFEPGTVGSVHDQVRERMRLLYASELVPRYLDARAQDLMKEGRDTFVRWRLAERNVVSSGMHVYLFPWMGDAVLHTLELQFHALDMAAEVQGPVIQVQGTQAEVEAALRGFVAAGPARAEALTAEVENLVIEKHDAFVEKSLLARDYASRHLDVQGAWQAAQRLTRSGGGNAASLPPG
ncbi:DEAD/DEAH box helicase [Corallococcus sp. AS-1-12]|uniref:DEAD/DEAH box helicase n=1 Tax=Corallococcus sp. AS-1-12 TaxID=2874598 RepID=UPI001CBC351E|nr:DEAD/DEAH box helicase [Corallococcus sp. AS-1-12]MBZ4333917.1 DEAD/DEAH box helicase [Corallococcus sp. AS-1-12]